MSSCSAASRREAPPSTCAITSMRMSAEYAFGIVRPQTNQCRQTRPFTGPWESCDSIRPEHALGLAGLIAAIDKVWAEGLSTMSASLERFSSGALLTGLQKWLLG